MADSRTLDRLLRAYAALTRDEAAALRAGDLDTVEEVQEKKSHLLDSLTALPASAKCCPDYEARLAAIRQQEIGNARLAARALDSLLTEQSAIGSATSHLTAVRGSYGRTTPGTSPTFSARG